MLFLCIHGTTKWRLAFVYFLYFCTTNFGNILKKYFGKQNVWALSSHHGLCLCQFPHFYYVWFLLYCVENNLLFSVLRCNSSCEAEAHVFPVKFISFLFYKLILPLSLDASLPFLCHLFRFRCDFWFPFRHLAAVPPKFYKWSKTASPMRRLPLQNGAIFWKLRLGCRVLKFGTDWSLHPRRGFEYDLPIIAKIVNLE